MTITFDTVWLLGVLLVSIRLAVLFFATPLDALSQIPAQMRVLMVLALSTVLTTALDIRPLTDVVNAYVLMAAVVSELVMGLLLAFGLHTAFASFMVAGKLMDFQAGFGAAEIMNPASGTSSPLMGMIFSLMAILFFFISNAHHYLFKGVAYSLSVVPPGQPVSALNLGAIVQQFGSLFVYGLIIAAPVIGVLLLVDTAIAVMGKSMPQMNVYFLFLPLKIVVALAMSAIAVRFISPLVENIFLSAFSYMQQVVM